MIRIEIEVQLDTDGSLLERHPLATDLMRKVCETVNDYAAPSTVVIRIEKDL